MTTNPDSPATSSHSRPASPDNASASRATSSSTPSEHSNTNKARTEQPTDSRSSAEHGELDEFEHPEQASQSASPPAPAGQPGVATAAAGDWQAIYSPPHSAYYFYNTRTHETTWTNPLQQPQPAASSSSTSPPPATDAEAEGEGQPSPTAASIYALQAAAAAQGIDPSLAYLDPSLAGPSSANPAFTYTAKFNSRTGAFARPDGRDPTHLSEYERAKRMSMAYFDVGEWEKDVEERHEQEAAEGKKRKRPTKKDLERYKEQKRLKKIAKTAWLRT